MSPLSPDPAPFPAPHLFLTRVHVRTYIDMMELLQQQLSDLADMDLDKILLTHMPANRTPQRVSLGS